MSMHDFHRKLESNDQKFESFRKLSQKRPDEVLKTITPFIMWWQWF